MGAGAVPTNMSVRKIHNRWCVDIRHAFVRYRRKSPLNTAEGARQYQATLLGRLARGEPIDPPRPEPPVPVVTFADFAAEWFEVYVRTNNKYSEQRSKECALRLHLLPAFGPMALDRVDVQGIEVYKRAKLAAGLSPKSVNNHLVVLAKALRTAVEWGRLASAPSAKMLRTERPDTRALSEGETARLLGAAADQEGGTMILAALRTGMRLGELCGLSWPDVDFDRRAITVRQARVRGRMTTPKSHRPRVLPLADDLAAALLPRRAADGPVFPRPDGTPMTEKASRWLLDLATRRAGLPAFGWHRLRHTFATSLHDRGATGFQVQQLLGHSSLAVTERYLHTSLTGLRSAVGLLAAAPASGSWAQGGHKAPERSPTEA